MQALVYKIESCQNPWFDLEIKAGGSSNWTKEEDTFLVFFSFLF